MLTELLGRMWAWDRVRELAPDVRCLRRSSATGNPRTAAVRRWTCCRPCGSRLADVHVFDRPCRPGEALLGDVDVLPGRLRAPGDGPDLGPGRRSPRRPGAGGGTGTEQDLLHPTDGATSEVHQHREPWRSSSFVTGSRWFGPRRCRWPSRSRCSGGPEVVGGFGGSALCTGGAVRHAEDAGDRGADVVPCAQRAPGRRGPRTPDDQRMERAGPPHPEGWWSQEAFSADFTVDLDPEGAWLEARLDELAPSVLTRRG